MNLAATIYITSPTSDTIWSYDDPTAISIHGYNFPLDAALTATFYYRGASSDDPRTYSKELTSDITLNEDGTSNVNVTIPIDIPYQNMTCWITIQNSEGGNSAGLMPSDSGKFTFVGGK